MKSENQQTNTERRIGKFWVYDCAKCNMEILRRFQNHMQAKLYCTDCAHKIRMEKQIKQKHKDVKEAFDL